MTCNACQTWVIPDDKHVSYMSTMFHTWQTCVIHVKLAWQICVIHVKCIFQTWHAERSLKRTCSLNSIGLTGSQCSPWTKTSGKKMGCTIIYKYVMWDSLKITKYLNCAEDCGLSAALDGFYKRSENWISISCRWCLLCHVLCDCCCCHLKKTLPLSCFMLFLFSSCENVKPGQCHNQTSKLTIAVLKMPSKVRCYGASIHL